MPPIARGRKTGPGRGGLMSNLLSRVAGAPITWGVDGSPGWGHMMDRDRVMSEMVEVGLSATELGPDGYLPRDPDEMAQYLKQYDLHVVGGFVVAVLYRPDLIDGVLAYVDRASRQLASTGSQVMVLGPASHLDGYDTSIDMTEDEWNTFLANLELLRDIAGRNGLVTALHPHWGMAIERRHHIERLLESCDVDFCLDTGHLFVAGVDPVAFTDMARGRVRHVHLKDVDDRLAGKVRSGELGFKQAVIDGMFKPLGHGDVDIAGVIRRLEASGFDGWYVLEQDASLTAEPEEGAGPKVDALLSFEHLREIAADLPDR
ncbi:MAG TPA: inosose dehydratase [Actinobacteria bacterium]|nr:inosose dehydratase [Actinomycetota bacterium]